MMTRGARPGRERARARNARCTRGHYRALVDLRGDEATHSAETSGQIDKDLPRVGGAFRNAFGPERAGERRIGTR